MLIDFEVENFRSYLERKTFSMVASSFGELSENLISVPELDLQLVRTAAIYGPNGAGKSNLLSAMNFVSELMQSPVYRMGAFPDNYSPFRLDPEAAINPSRFRMKFFVEGLLYEYLIAVRMGQIVEERFTAYPNGRPQEWFSRVGQQIKFNRTHLKGQKEMLKEMMASHLPFLALASAFRHPQLYTPTRWLTNNLRTRLGSMEPRQRYTGQRRSPGSVTAQMCHEDQSFLEWGSKFLKHADLGIQRLEIEVTEEKSEKAVPQFSEDGSFRMVSEEIVEARHVPYFIHSGGDGGAGRIALRDESQGTRRLFGMLVPLFEVLKEGQLAVIDEFSASLHPSLVREIIRAFHDPSRNPREAQLIFATHDTNLLSGKLFRRDQVWFAEKNIGGATDLYSLQDIKGVAADEPLEKGYLRGRYGALPFFSEFDFPPIIEEPSEEP